MPVNFLTAAIVSFPCPIAEASLAVQAIARIPWAFLPDRSDRGQGASNVYDQLRME